MLGSVVACMFDIELAVKVLSESFVLRRSKGLSLFLASCGVDADGGT